MSTLALYTDPNPAMAEFRRLGLNPTSIIQTPRTDIEQEVEKLLEARGEEFGEVLIADLATIGRSLKQIQRVLEVFNSFQLPVTNLQLNRALAERESVVLDSRQLGMFSAHESQMASERNMGRGPAEGSGAYVVDQTFAKEVRAMHSEGWGTRKIAEEMECSRSSVAKAISYSDEAVQALPVFPSKCPDCGVHHKGNCGLEESAAPVQSEFETRLFGVGRREGMVD